MALTDRALVGWTDTSCANNGKHSRLSFVEEELLCESLTTTAMRIKISMRYRWLGCVPYVRGSKVAVKDDPSAIEADRDIGGPN